jgi:agmatinase
MNEEATFSGLPACRDIAGLKADIAIVGIPHGTPYRLGEPSHSAQAPIAIRSAAKRYSAMLDHYDFDLGGPLLENNNVRVVDCGDVPGDPCDPEGNRKRATEMVRAIIDAGAVPIVLGGDDSVAIPFFRGYKGHGPFTLVQVDAHLDWRHEVNGVTEGFSSTMRRASEMPWIDKLIQVGMRGVGSARTEEVKEALDYGVQIVTAKEVHTKGVKPILNLVPDGTACLMTIDCDGLDPAIMPAVNAPVPGGLWFQQVLDLIHGLTKKADMCGFDLVEFAPDKDINGLAALTAGRLVFNMIGSLARSRLFAERPKK